MIKMFTKTKQVVNSEDLPSHWETKSIFNIVPNERTNYEKMKKEQEDEEWRVETLSDLLPTIALMMLLFLCVVFYSCPVLPDWLKPYQEIFRAFIHIFKQ
jgi:hypothetical protein